MTKVLVLTSTYPRWQGDTEPGFVHNLCRQFNNKLKIHVLAPHDQKAAGYEILDGVDVYRFRYFFPACETLAYRGGILENIKRNPLNILVVPLFICSQFIYAYLLHRKNRYDLIHAHWIIPQGFTGVLLKILARPKSRLLITSHGSDLFTLNNRIFIRFKSWIINHADHLTVVSNAMKDYCINNLIISDKKISIYPMGVDLKTRFISTTDYLKRQQLIFVGRLIKIKGIIYLLRAFEIVWNTNRGLKLIIIGTGPDLESLKEVMSGLSCKENVEFVGAVENSMLPSYYNKACIAVIPSVQEGFGLVVVEAQGCGCAVVVSDLPAVRDIVTDGKNGILAEPRSVESLVEKITLLLNDRKYAAQLADAGRRDAISRYDWTVVGKKYMDLMIELIKKDSGPDLPSLSGNGGTTD